MKRTTLLSVASFFVFTISFNVLSMNSGVGAKLGLSMGSLSGKAMGTMDSSLNKRMKTGLSGYGLAFMDLNNYIGAEVEVGFVMKGGKWTNKADDNQYITMNFNYLEIPLLIKGKIPLGIVKPMLYAGPTFGILLSSSASWHMGGTGFMSDTTISIPDSTINSTELGLAFGAGTTIDVGLGSLVVDLRYTLGLTNIPKATESDKKSTYYNESNYNLKSGTLAIMIGFIFKLPTPI
jgi:hypothetical protein